MLEGPKLLAIAARAIVAAVGQVARDLKPQLQLTKGFFNCLMLGLYASIVLPPTTRKKGKKLKTQVRMPLLQAHPVGHAIKGIRALQALPNGVPSTHKQIAKQSTQE